MLNEIGYGLLESIYKKMLEHIFSTIYFQIDVWSIIGQFVNNNNVDLIPAEPTKARLI